MLVGCLKMMESMDFEFQPLSTGGKNLRSVLNLLQNVALTKTYGFFERKTRPPHDLGDGCQDQVPCENPKAFIVVQ